MAAEGEAALVVSPTVKIHVEPIVGAEQVRENIRSNMTRGLPVIPWAKRKRRRKLIVAAGGPSLDPGEFSSGDVASINRCLEHLVSRDVVPKYWFAMDPQPMLAEYVIRHPKVIYCVASSCDPAVFDKLRGLDVRLWHCYNEQGEETVLPPGTPMLGGGHTMASRAPMLGRFMGYCRSELHGVDSSIENGKFHAYEMPPPDGNLVGVRVGDRVFWTNVAMLAQAKYLQDRIERWKGEGIKVEVKGSGLLPTMLECSGSFV